MKIDFTTPSGTPDPLPPAHGFYTPTDEWIDRHGLHIDEAEIWVELSDTGDYTNYGKTLRFSKDTGETYLSTYEKSHVFNEAPFEKVLFIGYLPNEEALEAVITYTNWNA